MLYTDTSAIDAINNGTDTPAWIFIGSNRVAKLGYKHTDGWRGYYTCTATKKHGWTEVDPDAIETVKRRKLANNTYLIDNGKRRAIRLHSTDIATEAGAGMIRIDTGGWDTMTTRERLHRFTTCSVYRDKGVTYVDGIELRDGMKVPGELAV